jgi:hypothetical protein
MKNGAGMDGGFSRSPRAVRDAAKSDALPPQQEQPAQTTGGL